jgi:hypothetical protein
MPIFLCKTSKQIFFVEDPKRNYSRDNDQFSYNGVEDLAIILPPHTLQEASRWYNYHPEFVAGTISREDISKVTPKRDVSTKPLETES